MRLVSVCPNPAIDHTMVLTSLSGAETQRASVSLTTAGGKGLNVARFAQGFGAEATAVAWLGETGAESMLALARRDGLDLRATIAPGRPVRICPVLVSESDGRVLVASDPAPLLDRSTWRDFVELAGCAASDADVVCVAGSFPRVEGEDAATSLLGALGSERPPWVDTSGGALASAAGLETVSLKVNLTEALGLLGDCSRGGPSPRGSALAAAAALAGDRRDVVVTAGPAGAASSTAAGLRWQDAPAVAAGNPTASGDAFMAAYLCAGRGALRDVTDPLQAGVLAGAANAGSWWPSAPPESVLALAGGCD